MADWRFVLTDNNFLPVGEILNASERKVANPLSKLDTASLKVRLDNPLADYLLSCEGYLKAYRDESLRFLGPLISAEETADNASASIAVNAVGQGWVLSKRLAGKSGTGTLFTTLTDRAEIVRQLIVAANSENETGIDTPATVFAASAVSYVAGPYRPVSEILTELATAFDGFDWRMLPVDNFADGLVTSQKVATFTARDVIGTDRTASAIFEYGTGRNNVDSYKRTVSREAQANKVWHITSNGPGAIGFPPISAIDATSISNWRLLEDLAQADLLDAAMRQQLVNEHVRVRKNPRQVIEFTPVAQMSGTADHRLPVLGSDYDVGDFIQARAVYGSNVRFDAAFRLYGVSFDIDDLGNEKAVLTLVDES